MPEDCDGNAGRFGGGDPEADLAKLEGSLACTPCKVIIPGCYKGASAQLKMVGFADSHWDLGWGHHGSIHRDLFTLGL